jgi:hypothetical protein
MSKSYWMQDWWSRRWLQGRSTHFLHHNPIFCRVVCIHMLLTWHKNNNFSNLWLDLDCQLEEENIYLKKLQHIYTKYIVKDFWSWKIWIDLLLVLLYTCIFLYELYLGYIIRTQYMIFFKKNMCIKIARKKLTKNNYGLLSGLKLTIFS